jgi:hypothetical protein
MTLAEALNASSGVADVYSDNNSTGNQGANSISGSVYEDKTTNTSDTIKVPHFVGGSLKIEAYVIKGNDTIKHKPLNTNYYYDY